MRRRSGSTAAAAAGRSFVADKDILLEDAVAGEGNFRAVVGHIGFLDAAVELRAVLVAAVAGKVNLQAAVGHTGFLATAGESLVILEATDAQRAGEFQMRYIQLKTVWIGMIQAAVTENWVLMSARSVRYSWPPFELRAFPRTMYYKQAFFPEQYDTYSHS